MRKLIVLAALLLSACNDETDVLIVSGNFKHTAQFEERGLKITAIHLNKVRETLANYDFQMGESELAQQHVNTINHAAAGTVVLNFGGGYETVVNSLNTYPGRKVYCAGLDYWGVELPEGCIEANSIYDLLNGLAPMSQTEWNASKRPLQDPTPQPLQSASARDWVVFIRNPNYLDDGIALRDHELSGDNFLVLDATDDDAEVCAGMVSCRSYFQRYSIGRREHSGRDEYLYAYMRWFMHRMGDSCPLLLFAWASSQDGRDAAASNPEWLSPTHNNVGSCWAGPTRIRGDGHIEPDFDAIDQASIDVASP